MAPRDRLIVPVFAVTTVIWAVSAIVALATGRVAVLTIVTAPYGAVVGYLVGHWRNGNGK